MRRRDKRAMTLRTRILLFCLGLTLTAMLLQMMFFNSSSSRIISRQTAMINEKTLSNLSDDLYLRIKEFENSLISVYHHKDFVRALSAGEDLSEYTSLAYTMAFEDFDTTMGLNALYLYTLDHELISFYSHAQTPIYAYPADIYDNTMPGSDEGVKDIVESNPSIMTVTSYYNVNRQTRLVRCILRILANGHTPIGYMICDVDPKGFAAIFDKYRYSDDQALWIQTGGRAALLCQLPADDPQTAACCEDLQAAFAKGDMRTPDGFALYSKALRKYDLTVYSLVSMAALNANQSALLQAMLIVFGVLACMFTVIVTMLSRGLTRPLEQMISAMQRIKSGETNLRLPQMKQDELGHLGSEFNDMLDQIESLIASEYQTTLQLNDAKYRALQMQVNPHFLYNTLDTMSAIAMSQDCPLVSTLCQALSSLFRYSLNMDEPLSTLSEEIHHLRNYLFVMNVRMQGSIQLTVDLPSSLLSTRVPRLSLQPLVENAINHGLRNKRGEKRVAIRAAQEGGVLRLMIEDNGTGMKEDVIREKLAYDPNAPLGDGSSIGLRNINARVKMLFGESYGLAIDSRPDEGCCVTLSIPITSEAGGQAEEENHG